MKKCMLVGLLALCATAFGELKVATVDMVLLVRNHPRYESNKKLLVGAERDYQLELDAMKDELDELQEEGRKITDELKSPMLSESAKKATEGKIMDVQQRFIRKQQDLRNTAMKNQQKLSELEGRLLKAQSDDLKERIGTFAAKNGYDLVLDSAAAIYAVKTIDVTDEILKDMGVDPKSVRAKESNEGK